MACDWTPSAGVPLLSASLTPAGRPFSTLHRRLQPGHIQLSPIQFKNISASSWDVQLLPSFCLNPISQLDDKRRHAVEEALRPKSKIEAINWGFFKHISVSRSADLDSRPPPMGHFSPCLSGRCHLPSGSIPLHYRPPSIALLNNGSPATPGPLRYCRCGHSLAHKQPQNCPVLEIDGGRRRRRGRLVRGGKLFQNDRTVPRLSTPHYCGSSVQVSLWADSIFHCNGPPGSTAFFLISPPLSSSIRGNNAISLLPATRSLTVRFSSTSFRPTPIRVWSDLLLQTGWQIKTRMRTCFSLAHKRFIYLHNILTNLNLNSGVNHVFYKLDLYLLQADELLSLKNAV